MGSKFTELCEMYQLSKIMLYQAFVHLYSFQLLFLFLFFNIYIYIFLLIKNRILEKCPEKPASINTART